MTIPANPVLPCQNLDVEVVSDIIEEYDDIEVTAKPEDNPDPDLDIRATVEKDTPSANTTGPDTPPAEPDYDVDVAATVAGETEPEVEVKASFSEEQEPEIEVRCLTGNSPIPATNTTTTPSNSEEASSSPGPPPLSPPEPDFDVEVSCLVQDAEEPDLVLTFSISGDSNEPADPPNHG